MAEASCSTYLVAKDQGMPFDAILGVGLGLDGVAGGSGPTPTRVAG